MSGKVCSNSDQEQTTDSGVLVGNGQDESLVPIHVYQNIYNQITGKTEAFQKNYKKLIQVHFEDIEQLHHMVEQTCKTYIVQASNLSVTVYYDGGTKESFTSFERFRVHSVGASSAVESIQLQYEFMLVLPENANPKRYTVTARLASKIIVNKSLQSQFFGAPPRIFLQMGEFTAVVEIKYVDYTVARNFLSLFDDWMKTVKCAPERRYVHWIRAHPYVVPRAARLISVILSAIIILKMYSQYVPVGSTDLHSFGMFSLFSVVGTSLIVMLSVWCSGFIENAFDRWSEIAFISISKGDERAIDAAKRNNTHALFRGVMGAVGTLAISVTAKIISNYFVK